MTDSINYPTPATPHSASGMTTAPPSTVVYAFWAFIASTAINIIGGLLLFTMRDSLTDAVRSSSVGNLNSQDLDAAVTLGIIIGLVVALVFAALYLLFAFKLKAGRNWARITLTVLTALQVISVLTTGATGASWLSYVALLAAVAGVVLSFLPTSNPYFATPRQAH